MPRQTRKKDRFAVLLRRASPDSESATPAPDAKKVSAAAQHMGRRGGHARALALSPAQRSAIARNAAKARWKDAKRVTKTD
jgi:hypothetical protein